MTTWINSDLLTIPGVFRDAAEAVGDKTALYVEDDALSYSTLVTKATEAAAGLRALGVGEGDAVGSLASNSVDLVATMLGCSMLGAVYAPINADYKGEFLRHQLATSEAKVVLVDQDLSAQINHVAESLPDLRHVIVHGDTGAADVSAVQVPGRIDVHAADAVYAPGGLLPGIKDPRGDAVSAVIFTSGTTGASKGVAMSQNYLCRSARQVFDLRGGTQDSVVYAALPLFHLAAISLVVLGTATRQATGALDNRFSPNNFWDRVKKFNADQTVMLGAMSTMVWNRPEEEGDADNPVKVALIAPMPPAIHKKFEERFGLTVLQLYAQSEAYPLTVASADAPAPPGYSGKENPLFTVKLFDENDNEVPTGSVGEVVVRPNSPHVMFEGYYKNPVGTNDVWRNGWMHTGDLGQFDENGYFEFVDRKKDYLRRRGENISSFEVERAIMSCPQVAEVAVVAAPSDVTEDDVVACVVAKGGADFDHVAFMDHCVNEMPYFAVPRHVWVLPDLPRTPTGRVQKYQLREQLRSEDLAKIEGLWDAQENGYVVKRERKK